MMSPFTKGDNTIYIKQLPVTKNKDGSVTRNKAVLSTENEWKKGNAWKLVVDFDIKLECSSDCVTYTELNKKVIGDPALYGIVVDESKFKNVTLKFPSAAAGTTGQTTSTADVMILNDEVFGEGKGVKKVTKSKYGISTGELFSHEMGHNFGLRHQKGDYTQKGLMSNKSKNIPITTGNQQEIINDNLDSIELDEGNK